MHPSHVLVAQMIKNLPAMWETWIQPVGWEDSMEKEMVTHSSILSCRISRTEEPAGYSLWSYKEFDITDGLTLSFFSLSHVLLQSPF